MRYLVGGLIGFAAGYVTGMYTEMRDHQETVERKIVKSPFAGVRRKGGAFAGVKQQR